MVDGSLLCVATAARQENGGGLRLRQPRAREVETTVRAATGKIYSCFRCLRIRAAGDYSSRMDKISFPIAGRPVLLAAACIVAVAGFRVARAVLLPELPNFSPVAAVAFCGGLFLPGALAWAVPIGALLVSDLALSVAAGFPAFGFSQTAAWICVAGIVWLGRWISAGGNFTLWKYFGALLGGSAGFYLVTNAVAWLLTPAYPRGLGGLWMSLTTGLPGYPPSWVFFRNSAFSDILFGAVMLAIIAAAAGASRRAGVTDLKSA